MCICACTCRLHKTTTRARRTTIGRSTRENDTTVRMRTFCNIIITSISYVRVIHTRRINPGNVTTLRTVRRSDTLIFFFFFNGGLIVSAIFRYRSRLQQPLNRFVTTAQQRHSSILIPLMIEKQTIYRTYYTHVHVRSVMVFCIFSIL